VKNRLPNLGSRFFYVHGRTVYLKEPGKAVRCMPMDGRYAARSQEGGAATTMDGRYVARSQEGGAATSTDGLYISRSQRRR